MKLPPPATAEEARVEMVPLIDVVFLVLVAFIYATAFLSPRTGLPVNLPRASQARRQKAATVTITIKRDGSLFLGKRPIQSDQLPQALAQAKRQNKQTTVYIKADRAAQIDPLINVMDIVRRLDIRKLTIATRRRAKAAGQ